MTEIPISTREVLKIQSGDVVVIKSPTALSELQVKHLHLAWETIWNGKAPTLMVLESGLDLVVLRKDTQ